MKINELKPAFGSKRKPKRVGRGIGSGHGKTSTRGHKGQKARSGGTKGPSFEGGQTPLQRRLPKRGFKNYPFKKEYAIINVKILERFSDNTIVTPELLLKEKVIKDIKDGLKVLGNGDLSKPLIVKAHAFSKSAIAKINAAGGKAELISQ